MARTKRGWSYPLQAVPSKFRSRRPKGAIKVAVAGNTGAKLKHAKELALLMIDYDATLPERANSAGTGELICLFSLFVLSFCMLTPVCVIISFFPFVYSVCVLLFIDQPLASCSVNPLPSACRAQGRHSRMQR